MTTTFHHPRASGLPDPDYDAEFYQDVPTKRFIAWAIDVVLISAITAVLTLFTLFTALFFLPFFFMTISFFYRWFTIASHSATPGMRIVALELRRNDGTRFDSATALLHTLGYLFSVVTFPLQLISIVLMLTSARRQSLTDMVLGTAAVNRGTL